jgi:hypothetical protein
MAKVFIWDTANNIKVREFSPVIPGIDQPAKMIGDLSFGPDGLLWGIACGTIFAMDPAKDFQVVKSKMVFASDYINNSNWRPYYLRWGTDGLLYTTVGRNIVVFNPETLACDVLQTDVGLMTIGKDGNIYYSQGSKLYKMNVLGAADTLQSVNISLDSVSFKRNETKPLQITTVMSNGMNANLASAQIEYISSDPKVVSVENGIVKGVKPGTADILVRVTLYGSTIESNKLSITVSKDRFSTK